MKKAIFLIPFLFISSCTPMKRAQTGLARSIVGEGNVTVDGHDVYCSEGPVCAEIEVLSINAENRDGGKVRVLFKNRTGNNALVQVRLEIKDKKGNIVAETRPENFPIPGTQEKSYEMPGLYRKNAQIRVIISKAY